MLARIEEKTMFFALRYNVVGREIWDNNGSLNYKAIFAKVPRPTTQASPSTPDMATLKTKLEHVAKGQESPSGSGSTPSRKANTFALQASTSLRARYDFSASLKAPWKRSPPTSTTPTKASHNNRPMSYPNFQKAGKQAMYESVRQAITRSPRILDPDSPGPTERPAPFYLNATNAGAASPKMAEADVGLGVEESPVSIMSRRRSRNHQRGYFDLDYSNSPLSSPSVKRTPTGSPVGGKLSLTALELMTGEREGEEAGERPQVWLALERGGSEESTPSETSNSNSESSQQSSPSASPREDKEREFGYAGARSPEGESYSSFLNKYCYYTGNDGQFLDSQLDVISRSQSLSNVEELLSTSPRPSYMFSPGDTPTRSPSFDDVVSVSSGSTTPTMRTAGFAPLIETPSMASAAR